jgi:hypothetical protein
VNDIGLVTDFKMDGNADFEFNSDEFAKEMEDISDNDIVIDKEDLNFIDNISWDTASLDDNIEEDSNEDNISQCSHGSAENFVKKPQKKK